MARIIFLGTAGSGVVVSKQIRSSAGIIVQVDNLQFHIDPGPGALVKAKEYGVNLHHTTAFLVSHAHTNHCNDLNVCIDAMTHNGIEQRGLALGSISVIQGTTEYPAVLSPHHGAFLERVIALEQGHKIGIEHIEVTALPTEHTDQTAIGFRLMCPRFTLSYTGDTGYTEPLVESLRGTDVLIVNVPYPAGKARWLNLDVDMATKIISQIRPKVAILTHFGLELLRADPLVAAREIQRITGVQTIAAQDGLSIAPEGYNYQHAPVKGYN